MRITIYCLYLKQVQGFQTTDSILPPTINIVLKSAGPQLNRKKKPTSVNVDIADEVRLKEQ